MDLQFAGEKSVGVEAWLLREKRLRIEGEVGLWEKKKGAKRRRGNGKNWGVRERMQRGNKMTGNGLVFGTVHGSNALPAACPACLQKRSGLGHWKGGVGEKRKRRRT